MMYLKRGKCKASAKKRHPVPLQNYIYKNKDIILNIVIQFPDNEDRRSMERMKKTVF